MKLWTWITLKYSDHRDDELRERGDKLLKELEKRRKRLAKKPKANVVELKRKSKNG